MSTPSSSTPTSNKKSQKRVLDSADTQSNKKTTSDPIASVDGEGDLEFEDPHEDELDEDDEDIAQIEQEYQRTHANKQKTKKQVQIAGAESMTDDLKFECDDEEEEEEEDIVTETATAESEQKAKESEDSAMERTKYVYRPGVDQLNAGEELDYDSTAYTMLHRMKVEWPCLSFDILPDSLGTGRTRFPHTMYVVGGTQADAAHKNKIMIMKISELHKTKHDDKDSEDEEDDGGESSDSDPEDLDDDPIIEEKSIQHRGGINRIRVCPQAPHLVATHSDQKAVHIWNIGPYVQALDKPAKETLSKNPSPLFTFKGHFDEGFAMAWSPKVTGRLITGDCDKGLFLYNMKANHDWEVNKTPFKGHSGSVEDLVWSPSEDEVFASCSTDKTIRIWDCRVTDKCATFVAAHKTDVNVLAWNQKAQHLLVSGADDGSIKVWDLRNFKSTTPAAHFKWHSKPITSVEWHPSEPSVLAVSSDDNTLTVWDMALEHDEMAGTGATLEGEVPPQLFFVHAGQQHIKEIHFHPQIPSTIVSTAYDGFNIFKPSNME